jgi:hypothetical protein
VQLGHDCLVLMLILGGLCVIIGIVKYLVTRIDSLKRSNKYLSLKTYTYWDQHELTSRKLCLGQFQLRQVETNMDQLLSIFHRQPIPVGVLLILCWSLWYIIPIPYVTLPFALALLRDGHSPPVKKPDRSQISQEGSMQSPQVPPATTYANNNAALDLGNPWREPDGRGDSAETANIATQPPASTLPRLVRTNEPNAQPLNVTQSRETVPPLPFVSMEPIGSEQFTLKPINLGQDPRTGNREQEPIRPGWKPVDSSGGPTNPDSYVRMYPSLSTEGIRSTQIPSTSTNLGQVAPENRTQEPSEPPPLNLSASTGQERVQFAGPTKPPTSSQEKPKLTGGKFPETRGASTGQSTERREAENSQKPTTSGPTSHKKRKSNTGIDLANILPPGSKRRSRGAVDDDMESVKG